MIFTIWLWFATLDINEVKWHQETHIVDGVTETSGHLWGCVKFCEDT